jgi:hypothetical protein
VKERYFVAGVLVMLPFLAGAVSEESPSGQGRDAFRFSDPDIVESSGLVAHDGLVVTTNDSGDSGRVFTVDARTGGTVGVTTWPSEPVDVEALAPAGPGHVWVGDIGDNRAVRDSVEVLRVPFGRGDVDAGTTAYDLVYPDGARDAEALVSHPLSGQLFVVTKGIFGGAVYAAPLRLQPDRPNALVEVGEAPGLVTDATFLPGGGGVVMRTYSKAYVSDFPSWQPVTSWTLPAQEQGEGVAVGPDGLLLSTEGARSRVLSVPLPDEARATDLRGSAWTALRWLATAGGVPL